MDFQIGKKSLEKHFFFFNKQKKDVKKLMAYVVKIRNNRNLPI